MLAEQQNFGEYIEQLADKSRRWDAWRVLNEAADAALASVREGLSHPDWHVRQVCAMLLDHHWDAASLQRLVLTLEDPKRKVRRAAVHSLGCDRCKGGENPIDAVPLLEKRLREDKSIKVRRMAALTLAIQQPNLRIARILRRVLRDETDPKLHKFTKWGLHRYGQARTQAAASQATGA
ncbi:MAG: HEAT repeat domain-containing protein [Candidatus Binataceae bacterium]